LLAPHQEEQGSEGEEAKWKRHQLHQCCGEPEILEQDNIIHVNGEDEENEVPLEEEEQPTRERLVKPSHNRVVMEVDQIDKAIASLACRDWLWRGSESYHQDCLCCFKHWLGMYQ
jgi:tRNA(Ser,Leu) C12 N-acetylase TAN1